MPKLVTVLSSRREPRLGPLTGRLTRLPPLRREVGPMKDVLHHGVDLWPRVSVALTGALAHKHRGGRFGKVWGVL
jgi:hypothetical protein